jgi:hypothetical protein
MTSIAHLSLALRENESLKADTATAQEPAKSFSITGRR